MVSFCRIALSEAVKNWDAEEKIGDVFVASFSKAVVLEIYSDFINNFSLAMECAKQVSTTIVLLFSFPLPPFTGKKPLLTCVVVVVFPQTHRNPSARAPCPTS